MTKFKNPIIIFLLFLTFIIPFLSMRNFSPVGDEITHLPSGFSYLKTGEIKLNPQHPPLIKILAALPLLFLDLKFNPADPNLIGTQTNEWQFGRDFLFNNGIDLVFFWGRIPMILLSVLLGWYIYKWGRDLFDEKAGLTALFLYAFMPNIIAHSQFVTTDMGLALFSFMAFYYLWRYFQNSAKINIVFSGLTLGLALGSKFSAVFLLPIFFVLPIIYVCKKYENLNRLFKINLFLKIILPLFGLSLLVIWALYFFPSDPLFYWRGLNAVYADQNSNYFYYLNGNFSPNGWWYYFLWAFIIKTPIPFLIALFGALICSVKSLVCQFRLGEFRRNLGETASNRRNNFFIFLPVAVFLFMASWKAHNIGVRYILPVYPFLILFVSGWISRLIQNSKLKNQNDPERIASQANGVGNSKIKNSSINRRIPKFYILSAPFRGTRPAIFICLILAAWYIYSAINIYPDYLAYFNELIGGSNNGYKYLDDSNLEWGHDFKRLAKYQKENPDLKVMLWTNIDADKFYGIKNILPLNSKSSWLNPSGKYAVSAHAVVRTKRLTGSDDLINWMDNYKPIDRIGQSFFIYEFP